MEAVMDQIFLGSKITADSDFSHEIKREAMTNLTWWLSGKESACQYKRGKFNLWVEKIPWRRKWQPAPAPVQAWEIPWTEEPSGL